MTKNDKSVDDGGAAKPQRAHTLVMTIEADTRDDLAWRLRQFADDLLRDEISVGCSGSPNVGAIYSYKHNPEMTHEQYFMDIDAWLRARKERRT